MADAFVRATDPETDEVVGVEIYQRLGNLGQTYQSVRPDNWHRKETGRDDSDEILAGTRDSRVNVRNRTWMSGAVRMVRPVGGQAPDIFNSKSLHRYAD